MKPKEIKRAKCAGCKALTATKEGYTCQLKKLMRWDIINSTACKPEPLVPCLKPTTDTQLENYLK